MPDHRYEPENSVSDNCELGAQRAAPLVFSGIIRECGGRVSAHPLLGATLQADAINGAPTKH